MSVINTDVQFTDTFGEEPEPNGSEEKEELLPVKKHKKPNRKYKSNHENHKRNHDNRNDKRKDDNRNDKRKGSRQQHVNKNGIVDMEKELKQYRNTKDELEREIKDLNTKLLNEIDKENEITWEYTLEAKNLELNKINDKIYEYQKKIKDRFLNNILKKQSKSIIQDSDVFKKAKEDAEYTAFIIVAKQPEDIATFFSTKDCNIRVSDKVVYPNRFTYYWDISVRYRSENVIPLSPGIEIPQKRMRDGNYKDIFFTLTWFFTNNEFINKCKTYYNQFNLNMEITKHKNFTYKKSFWIQLSLKKDGLLKFN